MATGRGNGGKAGVEQDTDPRTRYIYVGKEAEALEFAGSWRDRDHTV